MQSASEEHNALVERIYDIVVHPDRLEALIDTWSQRLSAQIASTEGFHLLGGHELLPHIERAELVLRHIYDATNIVPSPAGPAWVSSMRSAAAVVTRSGHVVAANTSAVAQLSLLPGSTLEKIALDVEDRTSLAKEIAVMRDPGDGTGRILRLRTLNQEQPIIVRLVEAIGGDHNQIGIVTTVVSWPEGLSLLVQSTFGLTTSETNVLRCLTIGKSVKEIAIETERSVDTIRSHVTALLAKTETRSQIELIRMTIGLLDVVDEPLIEQPNIQVYVSNSGNVYHALPLPDGRTNTYLSIGDQRGRSFVLMPNGIGTTRMPVRDERALMERGLRMIVPIRAGFGRSTPIPAGRDVYDVAAGDHVALLDHLGLERAPFVTLCDDFRMAVEINARKPGRISAIIGCGASLPIANPVHLARMTKFSRFVKTNARYAPRAMPYVALAFFALARRMGPRRFLQSVMSDSKSDLAALEDQDVLNAIVRGSEVSLAPGFAAHAAWAAEAIANISTDWTETLRNCSVPITLFVGEDDPFSPFETAQEFATANPHVRLIGFPNTGQIMFAHSERLFDLIEEALQADLIRAGVVEYS